MTRLLPVLAFLTIALVGVGGAAFVWVANQRAEKILFEAVTEEATNRIEARISRHMLLIEATAAMFEAKAGAISAQDFDTYFRNLDLKERRSGIAGLGYAAFVRQDERPALERAYGRLVGGPLQVWPETGNRYAAVVVLFQSADVGPPVPGYDAFSEGARRAAIERAIAAGMPQATEPLQLVRDPAQPQPGFAVFAPVYGPNFGISERGGDPQLPTGFVFAGFRIGELLRAALDFPPLQPVHLRVFDADDRGKLLYEYGAPGGGRFGDAYDVTRRVEVAGQEWRLEFQPTGGFRPSSARYLTLLLGAAAVLLAGFGAGLLGAQARAHRNSELLAETTQQNLLQKELMLQEMKHRIKNAITRIIAIARQTAAGAADLDGFTDTFTKRLQAMATAQDMLTRSKWQRADLRALLAQELAQVLGPAFDPASLDGPGVELDEKTTQALGLTFHELATNALKYATAPQSGSGLTIIWQTVAGTRGPELVIDWQERGAGPVEPPRQTGFGTRLIDANVRHDLRGSIAREFGPDGLQIRLTVPLATPAPAPAS